MNPHAPVSRSMAAPHSARASRWSALVEDFLAHSSTTPERLSAVLAADPDHPMGWCAKGFFAVLLARSEMRAAARGALASMQAGYATARPCPSSATRKR